jgi:hypothetical protein
VWAGLEGKSGGSSTGCTAYRVRWTQSGIVTHFNAQTRSCLTFSYMYPPASLVQPLQWRTRASGNQTNVIRSSLIQPLLCRQRASQVPAQVKQTESVTKPVAPSLNERGYRSVHTTHQRPMRDSILPIAPWQVSRSEAGIERVVEYRR